MIRRLTLRNWRAYETLDLKLRPGTTFIVASNGVGKTSILLGLLWGLFGENSDVDARTQIRAGSADATVEVEVALPPDDRILTITRTVALKGKPKPTFSLAGAKSDESAVAAALVDSFGADIPILRRLAFMLGGAHETARPFDLGEHLSDVFGVADLRAAADAARTFAKSAKANRERIRRGQDHNVNVSELRKELAARETQAASLKEVRTTLTKERDRSASAQETARAWATYDEELALHQAQVEAELQEARSFLGSTDIAELPEALAALGRVEASLQAEFSDTQRSAGAAEVRLAQAEQALGLLRGGNAGGVCPTCLRPLDVHDSTKAQSEQERAAEAARSDKSRSDLQAVEIETRLQLVRSIRRRLQDLHASPQEPKEERASIAEATLAWESALADLQQHDTEMGRTVGRIDEISNILSEHEAALLAEEALEQAHRREAIADAAIGTFTSLADSIAADRIEPVTREVQWRWKRVFGVEGLQLRPDGSIVRSVGDRELPFESFSGGEKVWALLVTRLLVLSASTKIGFLWLDEPLEHLDPRLRGLVARSLVKAVGSSGLRQVVVTTFEHGLAQVLAGTGAEVEVRYVRSLGSEDVLDTSSA